MADSSKREEIAVKGDFRSAFKSRDFRLYQAARLMVIVGAEAQSVAVAWQVYALTHSALDLGYTGLALFLPGVFVMLAAGHAADRFDRRRIILLCYGLLGPMASRMGKAADEEGHFYHVVRVSVISFLKGSSPLVAIEFARRAVPGHVRPSFQELENACKGKGAPAPEASEAPAAAA